MMQTNAPQRLPDAASQRLADLTLLAACLLLAGCSKSNMATVTGTITVDGEPAKVGAIAFFSADGRAPTAGAKIVEGRYTAQVPLGLSNVQVRVSKIVGERKIYDTPESPMRQVWAEVLPSKYNDDTELQLEVKPGTNEQDYDLSTK